MIKHKVSSGFTLIEVMLVLVIIGLMTSSFIYNFGFETESEKLEKAAKRFHAVFNMASDYAMLNNVELGVIFKARDYRFVYFDGSRWQDVPEEQAFLSPSEHPEFIELTLELEGLIWAEDNLVSQVVFEDEEGEDEEEEKEKLSPQVLVLSSGDITPFRLVFTLDALDFDPEFYVATGEFASPIRLEGPLEDAP